MNEEPGALRRAFAAVAWIDILGSRIVGALTAVLVAGVAMPAGAQQSNATASSTEGVLEVTIEDHPSSSRTRHYLNTDRGRFELRFAGAAPRLQGGSKVRVRGRQTGAVLELSAADANAITVTAAAPVNNALGEQKVAVLMANFSDDARQPYSAAQVADVVFNQTNGFVRENASQRTWLAGNVFGWYTLPVASTCDGFTIASQAKNAAAAAGVDLAGYTRFVFLFPNNANCSWSGQATMGGANYIWVNGTMELLVVGHELGHSFGLYHAHGLECGAAAVAANCTTLEYGDTLGIMGNNVAGHLGSAEKLRLGWTSDSNAAVRAINASGSYLIDAYAGNSGGNARALKVPRGADPATGLPRWYFIEYRQPLGYDAPLAGIWGNNIAAGVILRSGTDGDPNSHHLLDMTPDSSFYTDWFDPALVFGRSFSDVSAGVTITAVSGNGAVAQVDIAFSAAAGCQRVAPAVAMSGGTSAVAAGTGIAYGVSVTNRDSAACGGSTFLLTPAALPAGWGATLSASSIAVAPGASAALTVNVSSPPSAAAGSYAVGTDAANAAATAYRNVGTSTYTVAVPAAAQTLTTSVVTDKATYRVGESVISTARVFAGAAPAAGVGVQFVFVKPDGATATKLGTTDANGLAIVSLRLSRKDPRGVWRVDQGAGSAAASASFMLQ
jgi:Gametolysin peptidase M11/NPCBM-associated, NEW3 domain of alpha-galactosidase